MNINFEFIIPPVILGILITMITATNVVIMDSTVENQSTYYLQTNANNTVLLISEQIKHLQRIKSVNGSTLDFVEKISDTSDSTDVSIFKDGEYIKVAKTPRSGSTITTEYFLRNYTLNFEETVHGTSSAPFLKIKVITISSIAEQLDQERRYKASAERSIYLKNLHTSSIFNNTGS
ncbi:MAG: hypothetical protein BalsKO_23550 [Balneolaceae bacterium]